MTNLSRTETTPEPQSSRSQSGVDQQRRLSLASGDVEVRAGAQPVGPRIAGGDGAGRAAPARPKSWLWRRKVPRWTTKGASAGLMTVGVAGTATGIAAAAGKGAVIGAALGLSAGGVGAIVGAAIGGLVGAVIAAGIGGAIGYVAAGGGSRDEAEQTIERMQGEGLITKKQARALKDLSNDQLEELHRFPREPEDHPEDQEAYRKLLLLTAARDGPEKARALRAEMLNYESSDKAGMAAHNLWAVRAHLAADQTLAALPADQRGEVVRFVEDRAAAATREGKRLGQDDLTLLLNRALPRARLFDNRQSRAGRIRQQNAFSGARNQATQAMRRLLGEIRQADFSAERVANLLLEVDFQLGAMQEAEGISLPKGLQLRGEDVASRAIAEDAAERGLPAWQTLQAALVPDGALRTVVLAAQQYREQATEPTEQQLATWMVEGAERLVKTLGQIGGPAGGALEADRDELLRMPSKEAQGGPMSGGQMRQVASAALASEPVKQAIFRGVVDRLALDDVVDAGNRRLNARFNEWPNGGRARGVVRMIRRIDRARAATGAGFDTAFATAADKLLHKAKGLSPELRSELRQAQGTETERKELLGQIRAGLVSFCSKQEFMKEFKDWLRNEGQEH